MGLVSLRFPGQISTAHSRAVVWGLLGSSTLHTVGLVSLRSPGQFSTAHSGAVVSEVLWAVSSPLHAVGLWSEVSWAAPHCTQLGYGPWTFLCLLNCEWPPPCPGPWVGPGLHHLWEPGGWVTRQPPLHLGRLSLSTFWPSFSHLRNEEIWTGSVLSKPFGICIRIIFTKTKKKKKTKKKLKPQLRVFSPHLVS